MSGTAELCRCINAVEPAQTKSNACEHCWDQLLTAYVILLLLRLSAPVLSRLSRSQREKQTKQQKTGSGGRWVAVSFHFDPVLLKYAPAVPTSLSGIRVLSSFSQNNCHLWLLSSRLYAFP